MTQETWSQDIVPTLWSSSVFDTIKTHHALPAKNAVIHLTHSFKPNLMNEFIIGFVHDVQSEIDSVGPGSPIRLNRQAFFVERRFDFCGE